MPANFIAPWIKAADPAKEFLQAYQASASISQANARLAQSAAQADREYALQQQAMEQRQERQQRQDDQDAQQLEVTKSYREQQMQLGQQKLAQAKEYNDARIKQAAVRFGTMQQAQQKMASINAAEQDGTISSEEAENQKLAVFAESSAGNAPASASMAGIMERRQPAKAPLQTPLPGGGMAITGQANAPLRIIQPPKTATVNPDAALERSTLSQIAAVRKGLLDSSIPEEKGVPALKSLQQTYDDIQKRRAGPTATGTGQAEAPGQITTQEQFDALAPGSIYIGKGGKRYRKPGDETPPSIFKDEPVPESSHDEDEGRGGDDDQGGDTGKND
jgi:hypothetical protein